MGKKRIATQKGTTVDRSSLKSRSLSRGRRKKLGAGTLHVTATFNNTLVLLSDKEGNAVFSSSSGALGFKGAKKGTPFAAAKVGEVVGEHAKQIGVQSVNVIVKGVGSGRESAIRAFTGQGVDLESIEDRTPVPHNGPRPPKARRV